MVDLFKAKRVLFVRFLGIGDVLFTTPVIRFMKKKYPHLEITYLTSDFCAPILHGNSNIDQIMTYDIPSMHRIIRHPFQILNMVITLRKKFFDVIIVTHRSFFTILFIYLLGSKIRIGFDYKGWGMLLSEKVPLKENKYAPELYMGLLGAGYVEEEELKLELYISDEDKSYANTLSNGKTRDIIAIAPGGGNNAWMDMPRKRWPIARYAEVISNLSDKYDILLLGGKEDEAISRELKKMTASFMIDLTGKTTLRQAAALLQACKLFIGTDSSLLHIASAVDLPTISIFGPTNPDFFAPRGHRHIVIKSKVRCSPCFDYGNPHECKENICMTSVKADDVMLSVSKLLKQ